MDNQVGARMRALRESIKMPQIEAAKLAGCTQSTIAKMETGKVAPSLKLLLWWADYFDVSLDYLCCRTDKPQGKLYKGNLKHIEQSGNIKKFVDMCFDPKSPMNERLKETVMMMMIEEAKK